MSPSAIPHEQSEGPLTSAAIAKTLSKALPPTSTDDDTNSLPTLDASLLETHLTSTPRPVPPHDSPLRATNEICTDHMITVQWTCTTGWQAPQLKPYGPLSLMPTASCLHYATECFEGLKLYRGYDNRLRLFRPQRNANRMLMSAARIALPGFPPTELLKLIKHLCAVDGKRWLTQPGEFLYVRPTLIGDDPALGVQRPRSALLYIILTCFPRRDLVRGGMRLLASEEDTVRAWPGGFGYAKVGANYGPTLAAQGEAHKRGYQQVLWLLGNGNGDFEVTESGASNFFVVWRTKEGAVELVTAPLGHRVILDGVTRRSILELAEERLTSASTKLPASSSSSSSSSTSTTTLEPLTVHERTIHMSELVSASDEGRLLECFAVGTAFFVAAVSGIRFRDRDLEVSVGQEGVGGVYTAVLKGWLHDIMYGRVRHEWGVVVGGGEEEREGGVVVV